MNTMKIRRSNERGHANHGWLDTYHTFSFADYYDPQWMGYRSLRVINDDLRHAGQGLRHPSASRHGNHHLHAERGAGAQGFDGQRPGHPRRARRNTWRPARACCTASSIRTPEEAAHLLQIWIQPDETGRRAALRGEDRWPARRPASCIWSPARRAATARMAIHQDADLWLAKLEPGQKVAHAMAAGRHAWLHVAEGRVSVNGQELAAGDAAALDGRSAANVNALENSQVLLFDLN